MYKNNQELVFSASDLWLFHRSQFASWMARAELEGLTKNISKDKPDPLMTFLGEKGYKFEDKVLGQLKDEGKSVFEVNTDQPDDLQEKDSLDALKHGYDVVCQARLTLRSFAGYADFLIKVPGKSKLGDFHYEVWDSKLSRSIKPEYPIQICCYQEMLASIQGIISDESGLFLGNGDRVTFKTKDFYSFYKSLKESFLEFHSNFDAKEIPDPTLSSEYGDWSGYANSIILSKDHLSQVATITRSQIKKLEAAGINTMKQLADSSTSSIEGLNPSILDRLKAQAKLQVDSIGLERPLYEIIHEGSDGLSLLPPHSDLDVFFDIEGYPLDVGGLEYLWGSTYFDENGNRKFKDFWAHNHKEEKSVFIEFINWIYSRWKKDPSMHVYHYANYEITAIQKLMGRYAVCEDEVDTLLRNNVFIDLYKIVKQGLIIGEPKYSIKNVEHLYRGKRETEVGSGSDSVIVYEKWRELNDLGKQGYTWETSEILNDIRDYNIDDCNSTQELVEWLRKQQKTNGIEYIGSHEVYEPEVPENITELILFRDSLLVQSMEIEDKDPERSALLKIYAYSLEFHRRESKPVFWRFYERLSLTANDLYDDLACLAKCKRNSTIPYKPSARARNLVYEYEFNLDQEFRGMPAKTYHLLGQRNEDGKTVSVNFKDEFSQLEKGLIALQSKSPPPDMVTLVPNEYVNPDPIPKSVVEVIKEIHNSETPCAIRDFLNRTTPRIKGHESGMPIITETVPDKRLEQIIERVVQLDNSYMPIQGPPGAGKTFTGKNIILELLRLGKKVGICSNSHKAINNLLVGAVELAKEESIEAKFSTSSKTDPHLQELGIEIVKNIAISAFIDENQPAVIGTTAWGFAREDLIDAFDYLFIDEAGQVSVANLIGISRSAKNLILLGDQMQLPQPISGSHPCDSGMSVLEYLLKNQPTIPDHQGIFLDITFRMHSKVNQLISDLFYDSKLKASSDNDFQRIILPDNFKGNINIEAGIHYHPVEHNGNAQASDEEVQAIADILKELHQRNFEDKNKKQRPIGIDDILIVAPFNYQVNLLRQKLGDKYRIGTVDKFQGQEAPVVILSMAASDANEAPRGLSFLLDKHRLNVAISRAQALAIIVASPSLKLSATNTVEEQKVLNMYLRILEEGT